MFEKQLKLIAGFVWGELKSAAERKHRSNLLIRSNDSQWLLLSKYFWTEVLGDNPKSFANCQSMIFDTLYSAASCNYSVGVRSRWEFINWKDWKKNLKSNPMSKAQLKSYRSQMTSNLFRSILSAFWFHLWKRNLTLLPYQFQQKAEL